MNLTENITSLQAILDTVNALPDSGGGASIETCSAVFSSRGMPMGDGSEICVYLDGNMQSQSVDWSTLPTLTVVKGALITLYGWSSDSSMTNAVLVHYYMGAATVQILGNATLTFM